MAHWRNTFFVNVGMNSHCRWRHLLTPCVGEMSMRDYKALVKLKVKLVKNSINLIVS